jgi:hypothetical protein
MSTAAVIIFVIAQNAPPFAFSFTGFATMELEYGLEDAVQP